MSAQHTPGPTDADRAATQRFAIFDALCRHCGERLTHESINALTAEIVAEMSTGPTAWAFAKVTGSAA